MPGWESPSRGGVLALGADERLGNATSVIVKNGAEFDVAGFTETFGTLTLEGSNVVGAGGIIAPSSLVVNASALTSEIEPVLETGTTALAVNVGDGRADVDLRISGSLAGASRVVVGGAGTTELLGDNSGFASGVTRNGGRLVIDRRPRWVMEPFPSMRAHFAPRRISADGTLSPIP